MDSVCVFCGSGLGRRASYAVVAEALGTTLARRGLRLVYGGAAVGLMGVIADAALAAGGDVIGVLPRDLFKREVAHRGLTALHEVGSMHERKARMASLADAFIAMPGGNGTFDELFEIITWAQIGIHHKPIGLLDVDGYFAPLLALMEHASAEAFIAPQLLQRLLRSTDPAKLLDMLADAEQTASAPQPAGEVPEP